MKVSQLPYERFDCVKGAKDIYECVDGIKRANNVEEVIAWHDKAVEIVSHFSTMASLANMRFTLNTFDEFYLKEKTYYDEQSPEFSLAYNEIGKAMLQSKFIDELKRKLNPLIFEKYRIMEASSDPRIVEDKQKEAAICVEYNQLMSGMSFEFKGKEMPLSVLRGYFGSSDREERKAACIALGKGLAEHKAELDDIYDRLVKVRDAQAKKLGFDNYVKLGYLNMERMDYDRDMVEQFRRNVVEKLVPVICKLKEEIKNKLGIDEFMFYDDAVSFVDGEPKPKLDKEGIFKAAQEAYDEMDEEIGKFMRSMQEDEAFDVDLRKGKWGGGYCTNFSDFKQTFILANFNGSSDDIDVVTHEFGHALAMNYAFDGDPELFIGGNETAECHSMSMEFLAWPFMDKFFDEPQKYKFKHLMSSLSFIPYGCIVDEFQHIVYENPQLTPKERNEVYLKLEHKYRPYLSFSGLPYLEEGTRWQYQMHIFESPFYYIDYCLAQTIALSFLVASRYDYKDALRRYKEFAEKGGRVPFGRLCKEAGFLSPFEKGALDKVAAEIPQILKELN